MYFTHPEHRNKIRISRYESGAIRTLKSLGWIEQPLPEQTPKQIAATKKWKAAGNLRRLQMNMQSAIREEWHNLTQEQIKVLNRAEVIIQQLAKKYRAPTT
jgi:hypothetical protein